MAPKKRKGQGPQKPPAKKGKKVSEKEKVAQRTPNENFMIREYERHLRRTGGLREFHQLTAFRQLDEARHWNTRNNRATLNSRARGRQQRNLSALQITRGNDEYEHLFRHNLDFNRFANSHWSMGQSPEDVRRDRALLVQYWQQNEYTRQNRDVVIRATAAARNQLVDNRHSKNKVRLNIRADPTTVHDTLRQLIRDIDQHPTGMYLFESEDGSTYYTVTINNLWDVKRYLGESYEVPENAHESDTSLKDLIDRGQFFYVSRPQPVSTLTRMAARMQEPTRRTSRKRRTNGGFFAYLHSFEDEELCEELATLGVFSEIRDDQYKTNCLIEALMQVPEVSDCILESLINTCRRTHIRLTKLDEIGKYNGLHFVVHVMINGEDALEQTRISEKGDPTGIKVELGLYKNHYFLYKKTTITGFALERYLSKDPTICHPDGIYKDNWWQINSSDGWCRPHRGLLSTTLLRRLIELNLVEEVDKSNEQVYGTQFLRQVNQDFRTLEYPERFTKRMHPPRFQEINHEDPEEQDLWDQVSKAYVRITRANPKVGLPTCIRLKEQFAKYGLGPEEQLAALRKHVPPVAQVFYDFESTNPGDEKDQEPYCVCWSYYTGTEEEPEDIKWATGRECAIEFLEAVADAFGLPEHQQKRAPVVQLIAHNMNFDMSFVLKYIHKLNMTEKGLQFIQGHAEYTSRIKNKIQINFKDSIRMYDMSLAAFAKSQGINLDKDLMPHHLMKHDLYDRNGGIVNFKYASANCRYEGAELVQFQENCERWDCLFKDQNDQVQLDLQSYSLRYCKTDVKVLHKAWLQAVKYSLEHLGVDPNYFPTQASLSNFRMVLLGVYDGVYTIGGVPQEFIKGANRGGRVCLANNQQVDTKYEEDEDGILEPEIVDQDEVGLYWAAKVSCGGYPMGPPKILPEGQQEIMHYDAFFVDIVVTAVKKELAFPCVCIPTINAKGYEINEWTNELCGKTLRVGKRMLQSMIEFMQIEYEVVRGYYFDEGLNNAIKAVIEDLFESRMALKQAGNPAQTVLKLHGNAAYGYTAKKPVETETEYIPLNQINAYVLNWHNDIQEIVVMPNGEFRVTKYKSIIDQQNAIHVANTILDWSKYIMDKVFSCINTKYAYYTDTDSIHLQKKEAEKAAVRYREKYGADLFGDWLGQMNSDFEFKGTLIKENGKLKRNNHKAKGQIRGKRFLGIGKKTYLDILEDISGQVAYHVRMKGVPVNCIIDKVNDDYDGDIVALYEDLMRGEEVTFYLGRGTHIKFAYRKNHRVYTIEQPRTIKF